MTILVLGGTGFIGRRLIPLLIERGEDIVCLDINPGTADYSRFGARVKVLRGDVGQFDEVMAATVAAKPARIVNLAYYLGSEHPPHTALKL
ncbi:MAG: NAD-dependent epimerase/dehydratase family protein, partial [Stellaceae bacterium]